MLAGKSITVLVTGSIAAYKSAELVRELVKLGARVRVAMSDGATQFISPLTMQTLSGNPVSTKVLDMAEESQIGHIELADSADLVLVCPATANTIAKAATGLADDIVSTVLLATRAPVLFAPAMNVNMWHHPATQQNVATLKSRGVEIIDPEAGELACGWQGVGRLAELEVIVERIVAALTQKDLTSVEVVVSAGPTHEPLDQVRFLTNRSSGKMGYAIARAAARRGAKVTLVSGPTTLPAPKGIRFVAVETAEQMREKLLEMAAAKLSAGCLVRQVYMAAAVSDHRPAVADGGKLKLDKSKDFSLQLAPNRDILKELAESRAELIKKSGAELKIIGFAVEAGGQEELLSYAREKLKCKSCDMIVANSASEAFAGDSSRVWLIGKSGFEQEVATTTKEKIANVVLDKAQEL